MSEWLICIAVFSLGIIIWNSFQFKKSSNKYSYKNVQYKEIKLIKK